MGMRMHGSARPYLHPDLNSVEGVPGQTLGHPGHQPPAVLNHPLRHHREQHLTWVTPLRTQVRGPGLGATPVYPCPVPLP